MVCKAYGLGFSWFWVDKEASGFGVYMGPLVFRVGAYRFIGEMPNSP